jgi:hypothetical protein
MFPSDKNQRILIEKFNSVRKIRNLQRRGYRFEDLVYDLFRFYGLQPKKDHRATEMGDQIDTFAEFEGKQLIVEARYREKPAGRQAIADLHTKMGIRQPSTIGVYFSMSGFTSNAIECASRITDKIIVLFDRTKTWEVITSEKDLEKMLRKKIFLKTKESRMFLNIGEKDRNIEILSENHRDIIVDQEKMEYLATKSKGTGCLLFSPIVYGHSEKNYLIEMRYNYSIEFRDLLYILRAYEDIFGFTEKASFCINQTNYSWYGLGVNSFLKALENRARRYEKAKNIKKHHSEAVVFIDEIPRQPEGLLTPYLLPLGLFTLSFQPSIEIDSINYVSISFLLRNMPFSSDRYELFFEHLNDNSNLRGYPECVEVIDGSIETRLDLEGVIDIEDVGYSIRKDFHFKNREWIDCIVCKNPFLKRKIECSEEYYVWKNEGVYDLLRNFESYIMFLPEYDTTGSRSEYRLKEEWLLYVPSAGFPSICVNPVGYWVRH